MSEQTGKHVLIIMQLSRSQPLVIKSSCFEFAPVHITSTHSARSIVYET